MGSRWVDCVLTPFCALYGSKLSRTVVCIPTLTCGISEPYVHCASFQLHKTFGVLYCLYEHRNHRRASEYVTRFVVGTRVCLFIHYDAARTRGLSQEIAVAAMQVTRVVRPEATNKVSSLGPPCTQTASIHALAQSLGKWPNPVLLRGPADARHARSVKKSAAAAPD